MIHQPRRDFFRAAARTGLALGLAAAGRPLIGLSPKEGAAPGDDITLDVEVTEARVSRSRPETGIVTFKSMVHNAAGQALCEMVSPIIVARRAGAAAEQAR